MGTSEGQGSFFRFVAVGVAAAGLLLILTFLLAQMGLPPAAAGVTGYAGAFAFAYTAQRNWTFGGQAPHGRALPRYLAVQLICAGLAGVSAHITASLGWQPLVVSAVATTIASAAGFALSFTWAFAER